MKKEEILKSIGKKIALFRKQKGLSQFDLAEESGKMINTISNIERGKADPKVSTILAIMKVLDISLTDLSEGNEYPRALNLSLIRIITKLQDCDEKTLRLISQQIDISLELNQRADKNTHK